MATFIKLVAVMSNLVALSTACDFEWKGSDGWRWLQKISLDDWYYWTIDHFDSKDKIVITQERDRLKEITIKCLERYNSDRYLVEVEEAPKKTHYRCIKLEFLSKHVMRQSTTKKRVKRKKVDCLTDTYTEDDAVVFAHEVDPVPCPLTGGFQLLMHQSEAIGPSCFDSVDTYNPRIQFQCDVADAGGVRVEFGFSCEPNILKASQKMRGRRMTKLRCIGSWDEEDYSTVLIRMDNDIYLPWCLHYRKQAQDANTAIFQGEEYLQAYLTFDGRCTSTAFVDQTPRNTSTYGFLASYRPETDTKCTDKDYLNNCKHRSDACFESSECPANCKRCIESVGQKQCAFDDRTRGDWEQLGSSDTVKISISEKYMQSPTLGRFECRGNAGRGDTESVYPVYQKGTSDTCMPYYACTKIEYIAPGVIAFNIKSAVREDSTGEVTTCARTHDLRGIITPVNEQVTRTFFDRNQLKKTRCYIRPATFPSIVGECKIAVQACEGECDTLVADYDEDSCGYNGTNPLNIEKEHICYARLEAFDGITAILASRLDSSRFHCWVFSPTRLFIANPDMCNIDRIKTIFNDMSARTSYDPFNAISGPISGSGGPRATRSSSSTLSYNTIFIICGLAAGVALLFLGAQHRGFLA